MGDLHRAMGNQAQIVANIGVDLVLAECVGSIEKAIIATEACSVANLPIFLGLRHISNESLMQGHETFTNLIAALKGRKVDTILLMCSAPEIILPCLPRLPDEFEGIIGGIRQCWIPT